MSFYEILASKPISWIIPGLAGSLVILFCIRGIWPGIGQSKRPGRRLVFLSDDHAAAYVRLVLLVGGFALIAAAAYSFFRQESWVIKYLFALGIGGGVGAAELVSRYKDRPERAITTNPAAFYVLVNGLGSVLALYLISVFPNWLNWPSLDKWEAGTTVQAVMLAGFSAILFFRTSLFKLRVGDSDLAVGPSIVLDSLLAAADRAVDRVMAQPRAQFVQDLLGNVSFEKAASILPAHCLALMQNVSGSESQRIAGVVNALRADKDMPDKIKSFNLGLILLTVVGSRVLQTAVDGLKADLQDSTATLMNNVARVMADLPFDRARIMLPDYCFTLWPKPIGDDVKEKFRADAVGLAKLEDVPEEYKAVLLGIRLARLTDGATLQKAVEDLGSIIRGAPPPTNGPVLITGSISREQERQASRQPRSENRTDDSE